MSTNSIGNIKIESTLYQVRDDLPTLLTKLKQLKAKGIVKLYIHLGGINGIEFEEVEKIKQP